MKKNGFTIVELLAALALSGIVLTIIFSIFFTGIKQSGDTNKDLALQQEANIVATQLRNEYLKYDSDDEYSLSVENNQIVLNGNVISNRFQYKLNKLTIDGIENPNQTFSFTSFPPPTVQIEMEFFSGNSTYTLRTTLSRGV